MITIHNKNYDVSRFDHPGGNQLLAYYHGKDATEAFDAYHELTPAMRVRMRCMELGHGQGGDVSQLERDWRDLKTLVRRKGLLEHDAWNSTRDFAVSLSLFALTASLWTSYPLLAAALLGLAWQNTAFIGHDLGHMSIFQKKWVNASVGLVFGNLLTGIGLGWWRYTHNNHHVVTNSIEEDQDIQHQPALGLVKGSVYSDFYRRWLPYPWTRFQAWYFYPLMCVARLNLYIQSWLHVLKLPPHGHSSGHFHRPLEALCLLMFMSWYGYALTLHADCFVYSALLTHAVAGVLHIQILLSHYAEPVYRKTMRETDTKGWLEMQLRSTINIKSPNWLTEILYGGLHRQIEHHLFPRAPRRHLAAIEKLVVPFCRNHGLPHLSLGFVEANVRLIQCLNRVYLIDDLLQCRG